MGKRIHELEIVQEDWAFTREEEIRLEIIKNAGYILCAGRTSPPTIYETFELMHYLEHYLSSGAFPPDPKDPIAKFTIVGGTDAKPIK
jgi:hypothetical protein